MHRRTRHKVQYSLRAMIFGFAFIGAIACSDDNGGVSGSELNSSGDGGNAPAYKGLGPFVVLTTLEKGSFVGLLGTLGVGNYTNVEAYETGTDQFFTIHDNIVWVYPQWQSGGSYLRRYQITSGGLKPLDNFNVPAGAGPHFLLVQNETTAYLSLTQLGRVIRFNPKTLEITKTFDLSAYAFDDDDPQTPEDKNPDPNSLVIRDNKLYVACSQNNTPQTSHPGLSVVVINLATDKVETVIEDRTSSFSWTGVPGIKDSMFVDEKGDIYIQVAGSWGFVEGHKTGFVRIKAGETAFDSSYNFALNDIDVGGKDGVSYVYRPFYAGNGIVYSSVNLPKLLSDPPDWVNDRPIMIVEIDVYNKEVTPLPFPLSNSYAASLHFEGNHLVAGLNTTDGNGFYVYDVVQKKLLAEKPVVYTEGFVTHFLKVP